MRRRSRTKRPLATWRLDEVAEAKLEWLRRPGPVLDSRTAVIERAIGELYDREVALLHPIPDAGQTEQHDDPKEVR